MGERRPGESGETGVPLEPEEPGSLLQRAVSVLQSSSLDSSSQLGLQFSKAILVENDLFLSELKAFAKAKEAAGYSQEELQETFAFLLFDKEEEAKAVCQSGLRVNSSSISTLGDPAKGVYISKYSDFLQPRPWHPGKSGYIVICKLIKGKVRAIAENPTSTFTVPSPGYDCHESCTSRSSQYYVYEVSGGSTAERPRQVCPYIFLACQYREPKEMPVLASQSLAEQNHQGLYCPWRGQLSIQGRLLCTIALRNRYSPTIPAQLPPNLDINHVMGLADLKKKLPEAAFGKKNYTGHEVCFQGIYSSLYEVEISNKDQSKMDQLLEKLKENDLAIIKYLRDQGVLILLTSSALAREEGLDAKEPVTLLALFLFPSPRALSPPAAKQDPKDVKGTNTKNSTSSRKEHHSRNSIPLKITSVLPGLRYALRRAADSSSSTTSAIKGHLQEYSKLRGNSAGKKIPVPPAWEDDEGVDPPRSQKLSARSLAQLRRYLRDPESYTLAVSAALGCLSRAGRSSGAHPHPSSSSSALPKLSSPPRGVPTPFLDDFSKSVTSPTKPWGRKSRRKSSKTPGKNPAPQKAQANPEGGGSKSKGTAKKKTPLAASSSSSCPKNSGGSGEPMLKLANLRLPHGRKRGAEVLAAEIVHKPQCEGEDKESSAAPNGGEAKKPKTLENSDTEKIPGAESGPKAGKNKLQKKEENKAAKSPEKLQEQSGERGLKEPLPDLPNKSSSQSQSQGAATPRNEINSLTNPGVQRSEMNSLTIPGVQKTEMNSQTNPGIQRTEMNSLKIPGVQRTEMNSLTIPAIPRTEMNSLTIPGVQRSEMNSLTIPGVQRTEINSLTIPGVPRSEIYSLTIPAIQRSEINSLTIPGTPRKEIIPLAIPGITINPLTIPAIPRNPLTIPGISGNSLTIPGVSGNSLTIPGIQRNESNPLTIPGVSGNSLTIPGIQRDESNPLTIPGIQRSESNSLTIPGLQRTEINPLTIPGIQRSESNPLTVPAISGNSLTIPGIQRTEINSLTIPGLQRTEINSLTIPGVQRSESNPLTIPGAPGNSLTIPGAPGNSLTIPGAPGNSLTIPGAPGNSLTIPGAPGNSLTIPGAPGNSLTIPGAPGNSLTIPGAPGNSVTIPGAPGNSVTIPGAPGNSVTIPGAPGNSLTIPSLGFSQQGPNSESHALNLLADLALGSCIPPFIPKDSELILLESRDSTPQSLPVASDHKYHKADKEENQKKPTSSGNKTSQNQQNPEKTDPKDDKNSGIVSSNPIPATSELQVFSPRECADVNKHSIISDEHSYASPMPEDPKNPSDPKENPNPGLTPPKSSSRNVPGAPLVGKVLPFRHHHSNSSESAQSRGWGRKKEEFSKRHTVTVCGNSLSVTCAWEEEYLFHLDSRYTNDSLEKTVIRALHGPWDPKLPDDVEGMKLILHMWVALFYRKPSKLLSTSRKVVEHINPKKFVSINSSGAFLELSDDSQDCFGLETCPADSAWDPDQTPSSSLDPSPPSQGSLDPSPPSQGSLDPSPPPSSSLDPSSPSQGSSQADKEHSQAFPADSQTDVDGTPGDSTVSSSSGELPCGEEEEPSSTSCAEGVSLQDHSREKLEVEHREPQVVPRESGVCSGSAEEPDKEELLEARTPPSLSQDTPNTENPGSQSPNSSTAPRTEPQEKEEQQEKQQEGDSGSGPGPPEDEEGPGDSGRALEVEDDADPQAAHHSTPSEANPGNAEPGGATEEGEGSQEPSEHSEKEKEVEEEENEEFEDEGSFQSPVDLVLSESSDAEMECEQNPGNSASPEEFGAPEEEPAASPTSLPSPCPQRSPPGPSAGAGNDPGDDPQEVSPRREQLPDPSGAEVGSPHSPSGELQFPPEPSPARGAQPDSRMDSPAPPGDTLGCSEQENQDQAPSGERWERAGSTESPCGQGMSLALSPDSSSACLTSPDGSLDPWAAPEDQPMDSIQSPAQSELGRSSCLSQLGGDEAGPHLNSLDNEESNQGGNEVLGEEEQGSPCAKGMEELDDPMGAGDDLEDSPLDYPAPGDECRAEEREEDEFPEAENSPGNDTTNMELEPEIPLPEPEPSSSSREGISAIQELPRQEQNFPNIPGEPSPGVPGRRESVLCRLWKPCREGGAAQLSIPAWSLDSSLQPSCSQELIPAPCSSPGDELGPAELGSAPPSPCDPWDEDEEPLPEVFPPSPDSARWSRSCDSPRNSRGSPEEEEEDLGAGRTPSPAPFPSWECTLCEPWDECEHNPEGSQPFPDPEFADPEVGEGEIPDSPIPASPWDEHGDLPGEPLEFSDAEEIPEQLPSQDTHEGLAFEDPSEVDSFGDSEQEYFEGNSHSPLPSRNSCIMRSMDAAGARTSRDSSSRSSLHTEEHGEDWDWDWDIPRDPRSSVPGRQCQERMDNSQLPRRRHRRSRESHLARSLMGTWRSFEELTQNTLDMECLRFHYKLKETLRNGQPAFPSTSRSLFPPRSAPIPPSPRSRSPLQVTIPPSDTWPHRDTWPSRSRGRSRDPGAPLHLGKLRYHREPPEPRGDIGHILDEYSHFQRVVLGRAPRAGRDPPGPFRAGNGLDGLEPFRGMMEELRGALRSQLRRVAAAAQPGMFFLLETGQEPLFDTVKALLQARGFVRTDPAGFLGARRRRGERLLVIVRSEDVSSHIHTVPSLLELKRCPSVVFAGVDDPEELTGDTFQELFQAGGFVVSDEELLERVTLAQLQEVLKVLERLNRNGRWKWLLHHRESRKLRGDLRDDAQKKQLLLRRCQGEELLELLPFHACDSAPAGPRRVPCLLELQVQHVHARFAVYLTENPGSSREILESKGILVADINTFLGTVQEMAAPFRRSYW